MTDIKPHLPAPVRWAGIIAILQSLVGIGYAALLIYRNIQGYEDPSVVTTQETMQWVGIGTAAFFIFIFGTVLAGAISMVSGRRWGRGPVAILQMLLLPIAYNFFEAGAVLLAAATAISAVAGLLMIFNPAAIAWAARYHEA
ncbi:hypothetical protein [Corynebacterium sp. A21]|uniref:hypothetical protein n=1 Tax=Corynebacterium sp. A21 TaxID=3457318 RepID=UPI003FCEFCAE